MEERLASVMHVFYNNKSLFLEIRRQMMFTGVIADLFAIVGGGLIGVLINKGISPKIEAAIMNALAFSAIYIGIRSMETGENTIIIILSMVLGGIVGELINLDEKITLSARYLASKLPMNAESSTFSEGFITGSLIMGVGALSIVGPIESGLTGNHTIMFTNAVMDGVTSIMLASSLGVGVIFSGFLVFFYEALIVIFANGLNALLTNPMINDMNAVGSILILMIGLNMIKLTEIKVMNYVPALFIPILFFLLY